MLDFLFSTKYLAFGFRRFMFIIKVHKISCTDAYFLTQINLQIIEIFKLPSHLHLHSYDLDSNYLYSEDLNSDGTPLLSVQ